MDAFRGIGLVLSRPRLWPLCMAPTLAGLGLYVLAAWWLLTHPPAAFTEWQESIAFLNALGQVFYVLLVLVGLALLSVVVMSAFIGVIFDPLSREVEREVSGEFPPACPYPWKTLFADSLQRLGFNALLGLLAFGLGFIPVVGTIAAVAIAGVIGLLDYSSVGYLRRGKLFPVQRREMFARLDRPSVLFGLVVGLAALVPGLGLLLGPGFIAGGTLLARRKLTQ
ncbi:MAG: EI24 domain-containing protein [Armatimonas sp.]